MELRLELERLRRDNAQLQHTVSQLQQRVQELGVESDDLREICATKGVDIKDALAARQHRRMFARALAEYVPSTASPASEALNILEISTPHSPFHPESTAIAWQGHSICRQSRHASPNQAKCSSRDNVCGNLRGGHSKQ